jgi:Domain of unknown function (DUF4342)
MTQTDPNTANVEQKPVYEELQVVGEQLLVRVKELVHEGNVRRIIIKQEGHTILEIPLTVGVVGILALPQLAAIGALCALVSKCSIEVVRTEEPGVTIPKVDEDSNPDEYPPVL